MPAHHPTAQHGRPAETVSAVWSAEARSPAPRAPATHPWCRVRRRYSSLPANSTSPAGYATASAALQRSCSAGSAGGGSTCGCDRPTRRAIGGAGGHDFRAGWRDDGRDALSVPSPPPAGRRGSPRRRGRGGAWLDQPPPPAPNVRPPRPGGQAPTFGVTGLAARPGRPRAAPRRPVLPPWPPCHGSRAVRPRPRGRGVEVQRGRPRAQPPRRRDRRAAPSWPGCARSRRRDRRDRCPTACAYAARVLSFAIRLAKNSRNRATASGPASTISDGRTTSASPSATTTGSAAAGTRTPLPTADSPVDEPLEPLVIVHERIGQRVEPFHRLLRPVEPHLDPVPKNRHPLGQARQVRVEGLDGKASPGSRSPAPSGVRPPAAPVSPPRRERRPWARCFGSWRRNWGFGSVLWLPVSSARRSASTSPRDPETPRSRSTPGRVSRVRLSASSWLMASGMARGASRASCSPAGGQTSRRRRERSGLGCRGRDLEPPLTAAGRTSSTPAAGRRSRPPWRWGWPRCRRSPPTTRLRRLPTVGRRSV